MKHLSPILIPITIFLLLKLSNLGIRLSDTNIYFYTAHQLLEGKILYKDIFFTNFPMLPYVSMVYYYLVNKSLSWYYFTAPLEAAAVSYIIFLISKKRTRNTLTALTGSILYLFSFIVLTTSDHQTGVFLASLFAILSYYFLFEKKRYIIAGVFIAFALLTKAYFLPVFLALLLTLCIKEIKKVFPFLAGVLGATILILLPSLILAPNDLIKDVFTYSLTRSQGIDKSNILWFFIKHDFLLFLTILVNILLIKKRLFFGIFSIFTVLFVLFYQDIYYLYLNFAIPFLALSFALLTLRIQDRLKIKPLIITTIVLVFIVVNLIVYFSSFRNLQKITNIEQIVSIVKKQSPKVLYGTNDIAPALAYLTHTPLLQDIIDTNENIYKKGVLDAKTLTRNAISQHALIISKGVFYPTFNVKDDIVSEIFDKEALKKSCTLLESYPIKTEGLENRLNLFSCL